MAGGSQESSPCGGLLDEATLYFCRPPLALAKQTQLLRMPYIVQAHRNWKEEPKMPIFHLQWESQQPDSPDVSATQTVNKQVM